eukprot:9431967-Pyramimonas_sp.AAC.1
MASREDTVDAPSAPESTPSAPESTLSGAAGFSVDVRAAADLVSSVRSYPDDTTSVIAVIPQVALPALASKCVQLQTALETHTGVILLGGTGTGKTTVLRTLAAAVQSLRNQWKKSDPYPEVLKRGDLWRPSDPYPEVLKRELIGR